jgi:hypothetical protein
MGEVYHGKYAVHHGVAQGNQCIDTADLERVQKLLKDICHLISDEMDFISCAPPLKKGAGGIFFRFPPKNPSVSPFQKEGSVSSIIKGSQLRNTRIFRP